MKTLVIIIIAATITGIGAVAYAKNTMDMIGGLDISSPTTQSIQGSERSSFTAQPASLVVVYPKYIQDVPNDVILQPAPNTIQ